MSRPDKRAEKAPAGSFLAILLKETLHIRREPSTLVFALVIPVLQLALFGYAIDMKVENVRTVVLDMDQSNDSRRFVEALRNTRTFRIVAQVHNDFEFEQSIVAGRAQAGVRIPPNYAAQLLRGEQTTIQVLLDGSNSQVATTALNAAKLLGTMMSLERGKAFADTLQAAAARGPAGEIALPIEVRPRLLYNPDLISAFFFVPALVGIIFQNVTLFLTAFAIVRERELGTLEQLFVTPVSRSGLLLGKLIPYAVLGFIEMVVVLLVTVFAFGVPIRGDLLFLLAMAGLFLMTSLGLGLLVSTVARTQMEAMQIAFMVLMPSILLSGFVFPRESMPALIYLLSFAIPVTYFLEILRGVIVRGAGFAELWPWVAGLAISGVVILSLAMRRFRKQLD
jgi:ribosome-dependent ATPase